MVGNQFAIAVHTLAVLGFMKRHGEDRVSSTLIAKSVNTHPVAIRNLILSLRDAGLVHSKEGRGGGVSLAKAADKISLQQIYLAVEGKRVLETHGRMEFKQCPVSRKMQQVLPKIFSDIDNVVLKTLQGRTLQDIVDQV